MKNIFKNWKTTIVGLGMGGGFFNEAVIDPNAKQALIKAIMGVLAVIFGMVCKDHNVTGGNVEQ